jgi:hypothetical protein
VGYSFLTDEKNGLKVFEGVLLKEIVNNDELKNKFFVYDSDDNPYPRTGEFRFLFISNVSNPSNDHLGAQIAWFQDVSNLVDTLFVGLHVGPGGVARTTEIETLSMINVITGPRTYPLYSASMVPTSNGQFGRCPPCRFRISLTARG